MRCFQCESQEKKIENMMTLENSKIIWQENIARFFSRNLEQSVIANQSITNKTNTANKTNNSKKKNIYIKIKKNKGSVARQKPEGDSFERQRWLLSVEVWENA
jgi:hypothetical protein